MNDDILVLEKEKKELENDIDLIHDRIILIFYNLTKEKKINWAHTIHPSLGNDILIYENELFKVEISISGYHYFIKVEFSSVSSLILGSSKIRITREKSKNKPKKIDELVSLISLNKEIKYLKNKLMDLKKEYLLNEFFEKYAEEIEL